MARGIRSKRWFDKPPVGLNVKSGHPLGRGLYGAWLFNERQGTVKDIARRNHGTFTNGAVWTTSLFGPAFQGDGVGARLNCGTNPLLGALSPISVVAMIRSEGVHSNSVGTILAKRDAFTTSGNEFDFNLNATNANPASALNYTRDNVVVITSAANTIAQNRWTLVGATANALRSSLYVDGVLNTFNTTSGATGSASGATIEMGGLIVENVEHFNGKFAFVYLWNRVLTSSEMMWLRHEPYAFLAPPAPLIHYFFIPAAAAGFGVTKLRVPASTKFSIKPSTKLTLVNSS